jgi:hypothetical protein
MVASFGLDVFEKGLFKLMVFETQYTHTLAHSLH